MAWPLLDGLPDEDVKRLLSVARRRTFAKGEVVFHRDDPADSLHLVVRGRFGARVVTPLGEVSEVHVLTRAGVQPKQVVRNIESALMAQLGFKIDHRKISVAQTAHASSR